MGAQRKGHAICIPFPAQGHVNPMLKLAKLLHNHDFHITFVNTEYNHRRLLKARGADALHGLPSFRFETIPDGLPPSDTADATQDIPSLCESTTTTCLAPFKRLIARLNAADDAPPVSCIVSDGVMSFTADAAAELGLPEVLFWTTSACGFYAYTQFEKLIQMGYAPLKDTSYLSNGYLDTVVEGIPAMEGIRLRDIPSFIRTTNLDEFMIRFIFSETKRAHSASAIILNTFEALELDVLNALSAFLPPTYAVGPLHLLETELDDAHLDRLGSNLWKEEPECLEWLDSQEPNSVVYVNFGSITVMTPDQLTEFAWGLANSNRPFLWIIRPDLVSGDNAVLAPQFLEVTSGRGRLAGWCPQEKVLSHPAVGGFLTHSGWNSTLESLCSGVPMICWPFFAEQQTNCWYCCSRWGVGMEIDSDVKRDEVEKQVRSLMGGEEGEEMRKRAAEWKNLAAEAAKGSSRRNLSKVIDEVLLAKV
ncbi:7-deoxyloganetin glucosyltransferase-like [Salvia miltiorrhiza]|uniref:7-deoxyloganetin glucosyltransferase-like n=1 Tax=Salvia miltiorrhiza TaxID=226208 RepID=UPI0025AC75AA|nr:7-deoxyloganetin glucosyltransferase-like [Salvia miltiorrhiza]